jgi:tetratricopeptide (TPR) repeat protein
MKGLLLGAAAAALLLSGCGRIVDCERVAEGNRLCARGDYQGAILAYLGPGRSASGRAGDAATIDYDLANVYARLGEYAASSGLYASAEKGGGGALVADSFFNEGLSLYEQGRYEASWRAFRSALRLLDPTSRAAREGRRDLELAWRAWKKSDRLSPPAGIAPTSLRRGNEDESEQRLLRRLETGRWRPGIAAPAPPASSDY